MAKLFTRSTPAPKPAADSEARAALAKAIQAKAEAVEEHARLLGAGERLSEAWHYAVQAVGAAETALEQAKIDAPAHLVAVATGTAGEAPKTVAEARAELTAAQDALQAAREAKDSLLPRLKRAEEAVTWKDIALRSAVAVVMREAPAVVAMLEDLERLQREIADKSRALVWMADKIASTSGRSRDEWSPLETRIEMHKRGTEMPIVAWRDLWNSPDIPGAAPWQSAFDALMRDANAPVKV